MQNYRNAFLKLAIYYNENNRDTSKVVEVLDRMESNTVNNHPHLKEGGAKSQRIRKKISKTYGSIDIL